MARAEADDRWQRLPHWSRGSGPGIALLVAYWLLSYLNSPNGFLGTDTGGKVATLVAMARNDTYSSVDVGYWAARWDPTGALHPLYNSLHVGDQWVQVTTFPMLLLGEPLYRIGGYRLTLLLPMLGAIGCAYAAKALAQRFGADPKRQWWAFWIIGLASPVTIYALDFWEHTIGLALMAWGTVALLDLIERDDAWVRIWLGLAAGLGFGAAATMRTEALAYGAVLAATVGIAIVHRCRRVVPWIIPGVAFIAGVLTPVVANMALSRWILGSGLREERTASAAGGFGNDIALRLREGLATTIGLFGRGWGLIALGAISTGLIVWVTIRARKPIPMGSKPLIRIILGCVVFFYIAVWLRGFGFVPGITGAAPLAAVGAVAAWRTPVNAIGKLATIGALSALPLIWAVQWTGGAGPQWGGRYLLLSALILVVVGVTALPTLAKPVGPILIGISLAVTIFGLAWMSVRTHDIDRTFTALNNRPEPVLVAQGGMAFFPREGGAFYGDHHWLTTPRSGDLVRAAHVVQDAGFTSFALVGTSDSPPSDIGDFQAVATDHLEAFTDDWFTITTYELDRRPGSE